MTVAMIAFQTRKKKENKTWLKYIVWQINRGISTEINDEFSSSFLRDKVLKYEKTLKHANKCGILLVCHPATLGHKLVLFMKGMYFSSKMHPLLKFCLT
jgi:hypothetical protein